MKTSKIPPMQDLLPYIGNRKSAAELFKVTEKTIVSWLEKYDLYHPKHNFGCNKLDLDKAREIRILYKNGFEIKDIAKQYNVTFSSISRIIHNISYHEDKEIAEIKVIYNPTMISTSPKIS